MPILPTALQKLARASKAGGVIISAKLLTEMRRLHREANSFPRTTLPATSKSSTGVSFTLVNGGASPMLPGIPAPAQEAAAAVMGPKALRKEALRARREGVGAQERLGGTDPLPEKRNGVPAAAQSDIRWLARAGRRR
ncbi:MAG: hypothetical protein HS117_19215 [Verrucomicrobiaceae bacterium]|nr:hypothetical protein [Verrucomicrobiaceae bacterium]